MTAVGGDRPAGREGGGGCRFVSAVWAEGGGWRWTDSGVLHQRLLHDGGYLELLFGRHGGWWWCGGGPRKGWMRRSGGGIAVLSGFGWCPPRGWLCREALTRSRRGWLARHCDCDGWLVVTAAPQCRNGVARAAWMSSLGTGLTELGRAHLHHAAALQIASRPASHTGAPVGPGAGERGNLPYSVSYAWSILTRTAATPARPSEIAIPAPPISKSGNWPCN
jgi:hypothetical protein